MICRADAGIASIEELAQRAHQPTVLIGAPNSGSAVTWDAFTVLDPSYASVPTREIGGSEALGLVNEGEGADCLMYVSGLHSNYLSSVNDSGAELRLVAVDDPDLDDAKFAGLQIYEFQPIPAGTELSAAVLLAALTIQGAHDSTVPGWADRRFAAPPTRSR